MEAIDAIMSRRSIRRYVEKPVEEGKIEVILKAAMSAPSAGDERPWHFIVVRERELLDAVRDFHLYGICLEHARAAILVCGDPGLQLYPGEWWLQDCCAAAENILLAARALDLGTVWLSLYPLGDRVEATRSIFGLPEEIMPLCIIPVGYTEKPGGPVDRYDPERVHRDRW